MYNVKTIILKKILVNAVKTFSIVTELLPGDGRTDRHVAGLMSAYLGVHSLSLENGLPTPKAINSHSTAGNVPVALTFCHL